MLGSSLITEQVETLHLFSLKTKAFARFKLSHRIGGNLISIFFKDKSLCSVRFERNHRTGGILAFISSKDRSLCSV